MSEDYTYTNGLASLSFTDGAGKVRTNRVTTAGYTYDEAGNVTRGQAEGASPGTSIWQRYQYDAAGRLACTKDDSSVLIADYSYGASNHRLKQTEYGSGGTTCYYAWDGNSIIAEFSDTGSALSWTKSYVFLGGRLLATPTPGGTNYHHPDRLGTRLVTSETNGIVAAEQTTLPYGTALDVESTGTATNRRFTSYDRSQKTKLDYAVNRFYSACQGRFTQVDPIGMSAVDVGDPQSLNLYAYVGNDPVNRTDPDGLFWKKLFGWIGKALKWVAIALMVAVAVLLIIPAPWAGTALGKIAVFFMKHKWLSALIGGGSTLGFITPGINGSGAGGVSNFLAAVQKIDPKVVLKEAINLAKSALSKPRCRKFIAGPQGSDPADLLDLLYRTDRIKLDTTYYANGQTQGTKVGNERLYGAFSWIFLNKRTFLNETMDGMTKLYGIDTNTNRTRLVLHELSHATQAFGGDHRITIGKKTYKDAAGSEALNREIIKRCF